MDADWLDERIDVSYDEMQELVLQPSLNLGRTLLADSPTTENKEALASIYASQGLLYFKNNDRFDSVANAADAISQLYDEAIRLNPRRYQYYLARATMRFHGTNADLNQVEEDLRSAIRQYPTDVSTPSETVPHPEQHELAILWSSLANVLELRVLETRTASNPSVDNSAAELAGQMLAANRRAIQPEPGSGQSTRFAGPITTACIDTCPGR